jgi:glycosyltransferase involved in cell wall biosynthesis
MRLIKRYHPAVIWSTYPIATAHLIAFTLHRLTGLPWVADFRDSMTEDHYPADLSTRRCYRWIERQAVRYASRCVFTARATREMYLKRYPDLNPARCLLIPNGYDEKDFQGLTEAVDMPVRSNRPTRLLHSGLLYPEERDPRPFFRSVARLKKEGQETAKSLLIHLRAPGAEDYYSAILHELDIHDMVSLLPSLPYKQSLQECLDADGLLLFQAASCDHQVPAKAYEYLRLQRPILALTSETGDTAALLKDTGGATVVDLSDEQAIYSWLPRFLRSVRDGVHPFPDGRRVQQYEREQQAAEMARHLGQLVDQSLSGNV